MTEPPVLKPEQIEPVLRAALPPAERHRAPDLARALANLAAGKPLDPILVDIVGNLKGQNLSVSGGLISFGSGNQFGDIIFTGDIAGGHILRITLNLPAPPSAFQVPYPRNPLFRGRDAELTRLANILHAEGADTVAIVPVISGAGGIGKTQLASEFAHYFRDHFPGGIFWISMEQPDQVAAQIAACAGPGGLNLPGWETWSFEDRVAAVRQAWAAPVRRLVVFDNLEEPQLLQKWQPTSGETRVLVTSRRGVWARSSFVQAIPLQTLARSESVRLLLAPRYGDQVEAQLADLTIAQEADAIAEALGDLPLALALAGTYLEQIPRLSLVGYRARLEQAPLSHPSLQEELDEALPTRHATTITATIALSYKKLDLAVPTDMLALTLLQRMAQLAPAPIPQRLLIRLIEGNPDNREAAAEVDVPLRRLATLGLIEQLSDDSVAMHRLINTYVRVEDRDATTTMVQVQDGLSKEVSAINTAGYPLHGIPFLPHLYLVSQRTTTSVDDATLLKELGLLLQSQGDLASARPYLERALAIREQVLGPSHPDTAASLNDLGLLLQSQGDLASARPYLERALAIREQVLGPSHPDTAASLNDLGLLLKDQGDPTGARFYYERALAIREKVLEPAHFDMATSLNNLGRLFQDQGNLADARPYLQRALAIVEQVRGPMHPNTAAALNNLGRLFQDQGDLAGARPYLERALAIKEQVLGHMHPSTATSVNNLGMLLQDQGDLVGARPYLERALAIVEQVRGPMHPNTAISLNNLGMLLQAQGDLVGARPYYERALAIKEQVLGLTHPSTATSLNNLGNLLKSLGHLADAQLYYERALTIYEQVFGPMHPNTAAALNNLGRLFQDQGDLADARPYLERALVIYEQVLGPIHSDTAGILNNLGRLLQEQGNVVDARSYYERALTIYEQVLGPAHPSTAASLNNLGQLLQDQGDLVDARPYLERALAIYVQVLGPDHSNTRKVRDNLATIDRGAGNAELSRECDP